MTERNDQGGDRTALDHVVKQFIAAATADVKPHSLWMFLKLLVEAHLRASIKIMSGTEARVADRSSRSLRVRTTWKEK
jgi:hypothetical protein